MKAWKVYFWFCVVQLIMNISESLITQTGIIDVTNWLLLLFGIVGLQGYIYKIKYYSNSVWKIFGQMDGRYSHRRIQRE